MDSNAPLINDPTKLCGYCYDQEIPHLKYRISKNKVYSSFKPIKPRRIE